MVDREADPTWADQIAWLGRQGSPDAQANAALLAGVESRWAARVVPRTSMDILLLTVTGEAYPFPRCLFCTASAAVCELGLFPFGDGPVEISRCRLAEGADRLEAGLARLVGDLPNLPPSADNSDLWSAQGAWLERATGAEAGVMADIVRASRNEWQERVIPVPSAASLSFVAVDEAPTATRASVTLTPARRGWTIAYVSARDSGATTSFRCTQRRVLSRLQPVLARLRT